ncbi:hypothetical protein KCU77_g6084, partial [Aureobasidium melanogenum]
MTNFGVGIWVGGGECFPGGAIHSGLTLGVDTGEGLVVSTGDVTAAGNGFVASDGDDNGLGAGEKLDGFIVGNESRGKHVVATLAPLALRA